MRLRVSALYTLPQPGLDCRLRKQLAKNINFPPQLFIRNRLDKLLRRNRRLALEFPKLRRRSPRRPQSLSFADDLAHQANLLRLCRIETAPREQQIAYHRIPQIPLQSRDSAKPRNQSQPQLRKAKSRHFVGDDQIKL